MTAFQSLIWIQTQNYQLSSSLSLPTLVAGGSVCICDSVGVEEFKEEEDPLDNSNNSYIFSTPSPMRVLLSSWSLLVPLYPHQHIIAPLPHCTDSSTFDNNNDVYMYCQKSLKSQHQHQH